MNRTAILTFALLCVAILGCGPEANTTVTDGATPTEIEKYNALIEAQQKEAGGGEPK